MASSDIEIKVKPHSHPGIMAVAVLALVIGSVSLVTKACPPVPVPAGSPAKSEPAPAPAMPVAPSVDAAAEMKPVAPFVAPAPAVAAPVPVPASTPIAVEVKSL